MARYIATVEYDAGIIAWADLPDAWAEVDRATDRALTQPELRRSKPRRADFAAQPRTPITAVLDGVSGSYNIGAIFRLCDAFLVERLVICGSSCRPRWAPALGAVAGRSRRRHGPARGEGSRLLDCCCRVDRSECEPGCDAAAVSGGPRPGRRAVGDIAGGAGLCRRGCRGSDAGHGQQPERRHGRRHRVARDAAISAAAALRMKRPIDRHVGEQLRAIRERQGLSVEALATRVGISAAQLAAHEAGERIKPEVLYAIARPLNVLIAAFFVGTQTPERLKDELADFPLMETAELLRTFGRLDEAARRKALRIVQMVAGE